MPPLLQLQNLPGKGDGGWGKKSVSASFCFSPDQKIAIAISWGKKKKKKKAFWGIL